MKSLSRRFLISVGVMSLIVTILGTLGAFLVFQRELSNRQIAFLQDYVRERASNVDRRFSNLTALHKAAGEELERRMNRLSDADVLRLAGAHLVGVSAGGALVQLLALDVPDRVRSLVLISTSPAGPGDRDLPGPTAAFGEFVGSATVDWADAQSVVEYLVAYARVLAGSSGSLGAEGSKDPPLRTPESAAAATLRYLPALFRAALITLVLSCVSMLLAVASGMVIAIGRVYGGGLLRAALTGWVELVRGTPLLLQLFVLYFGLEAFVRLPALVAAVLGLGLNYGAYESEIYRGALQAVAPGQLEAARTLGFTTWQTLRLVRGPQAFKFALAPMTNDFVALLKDSSLVSMITVVELTKQTQILAANIGSWFLPGLVCAAMYLALSLPLARLARRLERRWGAGIHA